MFDRITFTTQDKNSSEKPIDIGWLVECLVFYQNTSVVANSNSLKQLILFFGVDHLIELIEIGALNITYTDSLLGVFTKPQNGVEVLDLVEASLPSLPYQDILRNHCIASVGKDGKGRRLARKIQDKITVTRHHPDILESARASVLDQNYISQAAKTVLSGKLNEKIDFSPLQFETKRTDDGIIVLTNANFPEINKIYHQTVPPEHSSITRASLLTDVLELEKELYFSSCNESEIASSKISSKLAAFKLDHIFQISQKTEEKLINFNDFVLNDTKDLRAVVNSGHITPSEIVKIVRNADRFKNWLQGIDNDSNLAREYHQAVIKESNLEKLPSKSVRFGTFTLAGIASDAVLTGGLGTAAGVALSTLDCFYLDKLLKGWKPNQFIDTELVPLISKKPI